jgi:small subunit ribosomal protein S9
MSINKYFYNTNVRAKILLPLVVTDLLCKLDVSITVRGGGTTGQTEAIIPGISKCLVKLDPEYKKKLEKHHFLINDPRIVERKKPGRQKARKGQVYRRR